MRSHLSSLKLVANACCMKRSNALRHSSATRDSPSALMPINCMIDSPSETGNSRNKRKKSLRLKPSSEDATFNNSTSMSCMLMQVLVQMKSRIVAESSPTQPLRLPWNIAKASPYKTSSAPSTLERISSTVTSTYVEPCVVATKSWALFGERFKLDAGLKAPQSTGGGAEKTVPSSEAKVNAVICTARLGLNWPSKRSCFFSDRAECTGWIGGACAFTDGTLTSSVFCVSLCGSSGMHKWKKLSRHSHSLLET
mmetsp:Transcript_1772/g.3018  ORF Transcript_1772/g.3018 Transcript_1772/m.3018 type:complete len:253 (-) Transcript_1772:77-835(-)